MESINIKTTIEQSAKGDSGAFSELYYHLVDRVFAYVVTRVYDRDTATEVTEDVFVELYRALPRCTYYSDPSFYAFVFTIVRRQLAARYKQNKKHEAVSVNEEIHSALRSGEITAETKLSVQQALESLDDVAREIVVLHHWSRFTFAEIGVLINMTEGAVRVRHHRAQSTLAKALQA
ncbi:MAG: hypothetical protein RLZZ480_555 [Candidatus Parcubacteria bacterium]|jgi:RNA polymerase sigma-70 factor (ECF subfamily)